MSSTSGPRPADTFVGRADVLARLDAAALPEAVVAVVGPPGVGKTRLVAEWVARSGRPVAGWADLAEVRGAGPLLDALLTATGLRLPVEGERAAVRLRSALAADPAAVLVLDGAEGVIDAVGALFAAPPCTIIVTTQRPLPGAAAIAIDPLDEAEAVSLFTDRARRVSPGFAPPPDLVAALVGRLDRLPLALELGAARMAILGPADLTARLDDRFRLLRPVGAGRALGDALAASWALLAPDVGRALAEVSVLQAPFPLEAAEAVVSGPGWAGDHLQELVLASLLRAAPEPGGGPVRFDLLDSVRAFASLRLDEQGGGAAARARRDAWVLREGEALAEAAGGPDGAAALAALSGHRAHLLATHAEALGRTGADALRAALAVNPLGALTGWAPEALARLEAGLARLDPEDAACAELGWVAVARLRMSLGALDAAEAALAALPAASIPSLPRILAAAHLLQLRGDLAAAVELLTPALVRARADGDGRAVAELATALAIARAGQARQGSDTAAAGLAESAALLVEAETEAARHGRERLRLLIRGQRGTAHKLRYETDEARRIYTDLLARHTAYGYRLDALSCRYSLGILATESGDVDTGVAHLTVAVDEARRLGESVIETRARVALGTALLAAGEFDATEEVLAVAEEAAAAAGFGVTRANAAHERGFLALVRGDAALARTRLDHAEEVATKVGAVLIRGLVRLSRAVARARLGDREGAAADLRDGEADARVSVEWGLPLDRPSGPLIFASIDALVRLAEVPGFVASGDAHGAGAAVRGAVAARARLAAESDGHDLRYRSIARLLDDALALARRDAGSAAPAHVLHVPADGAWFRLDGGPPVDLTHRVPLRRILVALVAHRAARAPGGLDVPALVAAAWPGERLLPEAASNRVYATVRLLRRVGLGPALASGADGYRLADDTWVVAA